MKEQIYQSKIIKWIKKKGGTAITGTLPTGEADIQGGYPYHGILRNIMIEVKTEFDYHRVMKCVREIDGRYVIAEDCKGLKKHEPLQILKLNNVRDLGGWALLAFSVNQVERYIARESK